MNPTAAIASMIVAMIITGANVPFGKIVVMEMPVYIFLALRFIVATLALYLIMRIEPGPRLHEVVGRHIGPLIVMSLFGSVLFMAFLLEGTKRTSATSAGIIMATLPAVVVLLGFLCLRRTPSVPQLVVVMLAVLGLMSINKVYEAKQNSAHIGNFLIVIAIFCEASFVIASQSVSMKIRPIRLAFAVSALSLVFVIPPAFMELRNFTPVVISTATWWLAIWYAVSSSVICPIFWYRGAPHVQPWMAGLATAAVPVAALLVSTFVLGEVMSIGQWLGAGFVITAIVLSVLWPAL